MSVTPGNGRYPARERERVSLTGAVSLALVTVIAVAALVADAVADPVPEAMPEPVARTVPSSGVWYCPVVAGEEERAVLSLAAVEQEASRVTVVRHPDGSFSEDQPIELAPGEQTRVVLEGADAQAPVTVRWTGGPAVASWRVSGGKAAAGPCAPAPAPIWYIPGFDTTLGSQSTLHLFNPFTLDAVARVSYATPEGRVELISTENVPVGAGQSVQVDLNEYQPEQPDLGVIVEVLAGRVIAQGEATIAPPGEDDEGPKGRTLLPAATEPSRSISFGYGAVGSNTQSWLSLFNPSDEDTAVEIGVSDPVPELSAYGEVAVPAGSAVRVDLTDYSTESLFGVTVETVGDVPVVASRFTAVQGEETASVAAALGVTKTAEERAIVGGGAGERAGTLALYNPGGLPANVTVAAGNGTPADWDEIPLAPNGFATLELADAGADRMEVPLVVSADEPIVATLRSSSRADPVAGLWTLAGVPAMDWTGPATRPPVSRDPGLLTVPAGVADEETTDDEPPVTLTEPPPADPTPRPSPS